MLRWRLIAAACILFPLLLIIWLDDQYHFGRPGIWLIPIAIIVSQMACKELCDLLRAKSLFLRPWAVHVATLIAVSAAGVPCLLTNTLAENSLGNTGWAWMGLVAGFSLIACVEIIRYEEPGLSLSRLSAGAFVLCYSGMLMAFFVQLRLLEPPRRGLAAVIGTILIVKLSDAGAYFTGRAFGRHKLFPLLSPGKTWEGVFGGLATSLAGSAFFFFFLLPYLNVEVNPLYCNWIWIGYSVSLVIAGIMGDLFESLLKRDAKIKDSSHWLPGLGGVLDVVDSMLAVAPLSYAWWISGLI